MRRHRGWAEPAHRGRHFELGGPLESCPDCRSMALRTVTDGEVTNFLCLDCGGCWHLELGWVHRVDPDTCPGCAFQPLCAVSHRPREVRREVGGASSPRRREVPAGG